MCNTSGSELECDVTGLTNGTTYSFRVQALNGAGWGDLSGSSNSVVPAGPEPEPVTITLAAGPRVKEGRKDRVTAAGTVSGLPPGSRLEPFVRLGSSGDFTRGAVSIAVAGDGTFRWTRSVGSRKSVSLYVRAVDVNSDSVSWAALPKWR